MKLYIAGPMRGYENWNYAAFDDAARRLRAGGFDVVSPAEHDREIGLVLAPDETLAPKTMHDLLMWDLNAISDCDGIALLPGWEESSGVKVELAMAEFLSKKVYVYTAHGNGSIYALNEVDAEDGYDGYPFEASNVAYGFVPSEDDEDGGPITWEEYAPPGGRRQVPSVHAEAGPGVENHEHTAWKKVVNVAKDRDSDWLHHWKMNTPVPPPKGFIRGNPADPNLLIVDDPVAKDMTEAQAKELFEWYKKASAQYRPVLDQLAAGLDEPVTYPKAPESHPDLEVPTPIPFEVIPGPPYEVRVTNPETGGAKGQKLARFDLIPPGPLWEVAELYGKGAEKYEDRNWEKGYAWSLSYAAMQRHANLFWAGNDEDEETGAHHLASVIFHAMALIQFGYDYPELDDRP